MMESIGNSSMDVDEEMQRKKEKKHAILEKRKEKRIEEIRQKKIEDTEKHVKEDEYDRFTLCFKQECDKLNEQLKCKGLEGSEKMTIAEHFQKLTESYENLWKYVNDSTIFLRSFQLEQSQKILKKLQNEITNKRNELIPKKKFAFKGKRTAALAEKETTVPKENTAKKYDFALNECGFKDKTNENIELEGSDINQRDVVMSNLKGSRIELKGHPGTVHLSDIQDCIILCGPVSGSVFVDNCNGTKIITGCQQLRVHNTTDTDFYLHVTSRAIIEDTSRVRFAPYNWKYDNLDADFEKSGLKVASNNWDHIDDFNWLAMDTPSPNWCVLPEDQRSDEW